MAKTILGKFDRLQIINRNNKKWVKLVGPFNVGQTETVYSPLQEVKNLGKVQERELSKAEYEFITRF